MIIMPKSRNPTRSAITISISIALVSLDRFSTAITPVQDKVSEKPFNINAIYQKEKRPLWSVSLDIEVDFW